MTLAVGLGGASRMLARVPDLADASRAARGTGLDAGSDVVVVIPARNEGAVIGALLHDLMMQERAPSRVVVVADGCTDDTEAVVRAFAASAPMRVELQSGEPTPPGWNPKSWALHQGVSQATEERLLFLDADVRLAPAAVDNLLRLHHQCGGLLSVAPRHDIIDPAEVLSVPFNVVALLGSSAHPSGPHGGTGVPTSPRAHGAAAAHAAFGPCLLIKQEDYRQAGGHLAVAGELLDDVALAQRCRRQGVALWLCRGGELVRYRMYPDGLGSLVEGWTKNIALGAARTPPGNALVVAAWITALLIPLRAATKARNTAGMKRALFYWIVVAAHTGWSGRRVGRFGPFAALGSPVWALVFAGVTARSAMLVMLGRPVRWKGRRLRDQRGVLEQPLGAKPFSNGAVPDVSGRGGGRRGGIQRAAGDGM